LELIEARPDEQRDGRTSILAVAAVALALIATLTGCSPPPEETPAAPQARRVPTVIVTDARNQDLRSEIRALGTTISREAIDVTARSTSVVASIEFSEGQDVRAGQVLARLDGREAAAQLALAQAAVKETRSRYNRSEALASSGTMSEFELDELAARLEADEASVRAAEARLDATIIRAPFAGQVGLRRVSIGSLVSPGDIITTLDDLDRILIDFDIPEVALSQVRLGMEIAARAAAWGDETFAGRVAAIDTRVDEATRTATVRAEVPNDNRRLRPGMFVEVALLGEPRPAILIPEQAIVPLGERHYVYRVEDGVAHRAEVELGIRRPGTVEIVAGLGDGDLVIVEGTQKVKDESRVDAVRSTDVARLEP
jgi:membrane fusion protein (multidrug efflux system)